MIKLFVPKARKEIVSNPILGKNTSVLEGTILKPSIAFRAIQRPVSSAQTDEMNLVRGRK